MEEKPTTEKKEKQRRSLQKSDKNVNKKGSKGLEEESKGEFEEFWPEGEEIEEAVAEEEPKSSKEDVESLSTTFSQASLEEPIPLDLRRSPRFKDVVGFVKEILEALVAKRPENVIDYFSEYSRRIHEKIIETFGIGEQYFFPAALFYSRFIRSFHLGFDKVIEDPEEIALATSFLPTEEINFEEEESHTKGEEYYATHIMEFEIEDDDFDENGRHGKPVYYDPKIDYEYNEFDYNFLDQMKIFDDVGIGLTRLEQFEIHMALIKMNRKRKLTNLKFWGKIKGLYRDYYIAEADMYNLSEEKYDELEEVEELQTNLIPQDSLQLFEEEGDKEQPYLLTKILPDEELAGELSIEAVEVDDENEADEDIVLFEEMGLEVEEEQFAEEEPLQKEITPFELDVATSPIPLPKLTLLNYKLPPLPQAKFTLEKQPPVEQPGEGVNRKIFFVCNDPKADWIRLPHVTPEQIVVARQIKRFFTGYLSARILSYPIFPGIEMHYLRAQLARISAGTQISPAGYFRFDEGEEAYDPDEIAAGRGGVLINKEFDPLAIKDLTDPTLAFWVHHTPHILKQGRTVWYNVNVKKRRQMLEGEEFGELGEEPIEEPVIGETGPPLLTSLAEDIYFEGIPPWTVRPALECAPADSCIYVRSNLWPGAYSFNWGRRIGFLYIGWGMKFKPSGFTPTYPHPPLTEFPMSIEIMEAKDPTVTEEEDYRKQVEEWWRKLHPPLPDLGEAAGEDREGED